MCSCCSPERSDVVNSNTSTKKTDDIIAFFRTLPSTSYAMFDSGYKYIYDKYNDVYRYVPCAADVAGLCISTTNNSETWFSPAGYNRGQVRKQRNLLTVQNRQKEIDSTLTESTQSLHSLVKVSFSSETRLVSHLLPHSTESTFVVSLLNLRRTLRTSPSINSLRSTMNSQDLDSERIEPYLRGVQGRRGIYDFLVVCDTSNNTADVIDRNELVAEIFIKPSHN